jgi:hypothetical protein
LKNSTSGNIFFIILIAILLFAALGYAVTQSMRSSGGDVNKEMVELQASQILQFTTAIKGAIARMILNGVPLSGLCFDSAGFLSVDATWGGTWYNHAGCAAPANRVFESTGGGVAWVGLPKELKADPYPDNTWWITGNGAVQHIQTTAGDLIFFFSMDRTNAYAINFCSAVNKKLGIVYDLNNSDPVNINDWRSGYRGIFNDTAGSSAIVGDAQPIFAGKETGCFREGHGGGLLIFYSVLYGR